MTIEHRRDSFCGKMSACNNLRQYGIPLLAHLAAHREPSSREEFAPDLDGSPASAAWSTGLRNLRVGAIGARPAAFNTVRYSEKLLEAHGISVETLDLSEVFGRIGKLARRPRRRAQQAGRRSTTTSPTSGVPAAALVKMAKFGVVIDDWMSETDVDDQRHAVLDVHGGISSASCRAR